MSGTERARAFNRSEAYNAMTRYGRTLTDDEVELKRTVEQTVNFFEALLIYHKAKPPMAVASLSEISPNKRWLFTGERYLVGAGSWSCAPKKDQQLTVAFREDCVKLKHGGRSIINGDDLHYAMVHLMNDRKDSSFHISQMKKRIPHKLKDIRTNSKYYCLCLGGIEEPTVSNHRMDMMKAFVLTESMNDVLRLFVNDVYYKVEEKYVTVYDRWFAVRLPRLPWAKEI